MENNQTQQKQIKIKGMHCKSCAGLIENGLKTLEGVEKVEVSYIQEEALIQFNPEQVSFDKIIEKIKELGYNINLENKTNNPQSEKIIRIRLEKPSILMALIGLILALMIMNLYYTINLRNKLAFVAGGVDLEIESQESQSAGVLKEISPKQPSQQEALPNQPSQQQPSQGEIEMMDDDPGKGSEDAPIVIIEFSEFECPFCGRFFRQTFSQIEENYINTGKVRYIYRDFPLDFHQYAQKAAEAAECADEQDKFWEYHDKLFENQNALDINNLKQYAKDLSLNTAEFNNCLDSGKMTSEVQKDLSDGVKYGVNGTPTFFINGTKLVGAQPYSVFEQVIEQELKKIK